MMPVAVNRLLLSFVRDSRKLALENKEVEILLRSLEVKLARLLSHMYNVT